MSKARKEPEKTSIKKVTWADNSDTTKEMMDRLNDVSVLPRESKTYREIMNQAMEIEKQAYQFNVRIIELLKTLDSSEAINGKGLQKSDTLTNEAKNNIGTYRKTVNDLRNEKALLAKKGDDLREKINNNKLLNPIEHNQIRKTLDRIPRYLDEKAPVSGATNEQRKNAANEARKKKLSSFTVTQSRTEYVINGIETLIAAKTAEKRHQKQEKQDASPERQNEIKQIMMKK